MYKSFYVVVRNKANKRSVIGTDCGTLEFATLMAQGERKCSKRTVFVREYTQAGLFAKRKLVKEHEVA
jgi:hypothetical protein